VPRYGWDAALTLGRAGDRCELVASADLVTSEEHAGEHGGTDDRRRPGGQPPSSTTSMSARSIAW
jgi:hypothetical protein